MSYDHWKCTDRSRENEEPPVEQDEWGFMDQECKVCHKQIYTGELCANCAIGNDPFVTSKFSVDRR